MSDDKSYIDYFDVLGLTEDCKTGEIKKNYKRLMKNLIIEISRAEITPERRDKYLLDLATHNAAFYILRDNTLREKYVADRKRVIDLETEWNAAVQAGGEDEAAESKREELRRAFDVAIRHFLSTYMEELMLEAGRDGLCVEASHWDMAHERHAGRVLRHFRQQLYHTIHERLPYFDVTEPTIDWDERAGTARAILAEGGE